MVNFVDSCRTYGSMFKINQISINTNTIVDFVDSYRTYGIMLKIH